MGGKGEKKFKIQSAKLWSRFAVKRKLFWPAAPLFFLDFSASKCTLKNMPLTGGKE
jgi:hypothetical protein